ncbi:hypothetical protein D9613_005789 [Agrocybe pediades]|uniref:Polyketide synthase-like phosphopantetheine-binding domain-containing protein n=1 Tax=Agrocybe pediades TaxID=84607 RepID=A0A8H4VRC7_9AGAR|nr:hypothetical protein D9613_005789 [Agrocybe pediades]
MALYPAARIHPPVPCLTVPDTLEYHRKHNATLPIYVYVDDQDEEPKQVSYLEFDRACHRVASTIASSIPPSPDINTRPVVALIALTDSLLFQALVIGMMKGGFIPFPISPRNTAAAVVHLLKKSSSHYLLTTQVTLKPLIDGVKRELQSSDPTYELVIQEIPSLYVAYPKLAKEREEDPFTPFISHLKPVITDVAMFLHSSGSTGFPKAIPQTHEMISHWGSMRPSDYFKEHKPDIRLAGMHLPPFHTLAVHCQIVFPLYATTTVALYPPVAVAPDLLPITPTPDNIISHIARTRSNALMTTPTLFSIWVQDPQALEVLSNLELILSSGGPVTPKIGNLLVSSGANLFTTYGGTEFGGVTCLTRREGDGDDWTYMEFSERCRIRWMPQGDGTYECQFLAHKDHKLSVENLPDVPGYATADLFEPHPTKDYLWKIVGRIDDVIIHSSGEKTVPAPMEDLILSSPYLIGAIMFGRNHDQAGILVEPKPSFAVDTEDEKQVAEFRNLIWPVIEEANEIAPSFSRIFKEMILITHKNKPLPRAGKGTVMRKAALLEYEAEIEALYSTVEEAAQPSETIQPPPSWTTEDIINWISEHVQDLNSGRKIAPGDDLFVHGFDSLSATILRRRISGALKSLKGPSKDSALQAVTQNTIYTYPTINALATYLCSLVSGQEQAQLDSVALLEKRMQNIEEMVRKYSLPPASEAQNASLPPPPATSVVLITGSTGSIGSYVLEGLIRDTRIKRIYTLNRPAKSPLYERHVEAFKQKGFDVGLLDGGKVIFLHGDLASELLGLDEIIYQEIQNSVDAIIHIAWRLDFNLSLSSFESNIAGMRNLIEFARSSARGPAAIRFVFTSSVASTASWNTGGDNQHKEVPEDVISDAKYAVGSGYGESKYVVDRILATSGLPYATSLRIGQVSGGPPNGAWSPTDWVPIMIKSSIQLGSLPSAVGTVSWTPMDAVSRCISDVIFFDPSERDIKNFPNTLNIRHPKPVPWHTVMQYVVEALDISKEDGKEALRLVPFQEWISTLDAYSTKHEDTSKVPAVNLLDFFKHASEAGANVATSDEAAGVSTFSVAKMLSVSPALREQPPLGHADVQMWIKYWRDIGFLE